MPRQPPGGTVTFLFTDIEDSTRLWEDSPTDMADALRIHDAIVRGSIERHGGYVFATGGDGFGAAFSTAADAAAAAVESQEQLRDDTVVDFAVRMGLHTGEAIQRDRSYFGSDVNRAARLMSLAHGGQVLVSDATEVLLRDRVVLRPLGEHRLRGLRGRISVYQIVADGLATEFPVLRSVDPFAGNLPQQLSSLVGREQMVVDVADLTRSNRLVTLTGVGGVGKTRLALEVGAEVAGEFVDGVWLVELASIGDPASVPAAIATVLGITPQSGAALIDTVADALRGRRLLLVVDNCEHVLAAAGSAVATDPGPVRRPSRSSRRRASRSASTGETPFAVVPLTLEGGPISHAVTLFVERARAVRPDFGLREAETADAVTEICTNLDGLPLGIELAASRMAAMSAVEVRDRLADRFRLLQETSPAPERHLTLGHAVEWSYDLLTDDEQRLLRLTSVFAGGFDLASLYAVTDAADEVEVLRHLDSLVRKSLVVADHTATRTRYRLFETIRQFAEDRLAQAGDLESSRARHARHFAQQAADRWERWNGPGWRDAVDWVEVELGNLREGYQWSARQRRARGGHRHRRARRVDGLLRPAVRDARLGRGAARAGIGCRRHASPPPVHGRRLRVLRRTRRGRSRERASSDRAGDGHPLRRVRTRVRVVRRGARQRVLRRSRPLRRAHRRGGAPTTAAIGVTGWPRTSTACSRAVASRRHWRSPRSPSRRRDRSATRTGSPMRSGSRGWRSRRRTCVARSRPGTRASRSCASSASTSSKASSLATRHACTPLTVIRTPR